MTKFLISAALMSLLAPAVVAQDMPPPAQGGGMTFDEFAARQRHHLMRLDTDHDGRISRDEFAARAAMTSDRHGGDTPTGKGDKPHDGSRMFARIDTNNDGYLDAAEINAWIAQRFARLDTNHDRVLTPDERHAMRGDAAPEQ